MSFIVAALILIHVAISLVGIVSGFVVAYGLLTARRLDRWTLVFLATTVATSVTGFFIPAPRFLPSHAFGILSMLLLPVAIYAHYPRRLAGHWRWVYVVTAMIALYLNVFVLVVQAFLKIPALHVLAPTQSEPPFAIAQLVVFVLFVAVTVGGIVRFRGASTLQQPSSLQAV